MAWQQNPWNGYGGFGQGPGPYQAPPMRQGQQQSMEWIRVPNPGDFEQVAVQPGQLIAAVTTAGTLNVQAYYNGVPIAATLKTLPVAVGSIQVELNNLLYLVAPEGCACADVVYPIDVYAWMSDSGAGSVSAVTVNLIKEA